MALPFFEHTKTRHRPTAIVLLALLSLVAYALLIGSSLDLRAINAQRRNVDAAFHSFRQAALLRHKQRLKDLAAADADSFSQNRDAPFQLRQEDELGALTGFLASLTANIVPPNTDPTQPLDPQIVLDFDTRSPNAEDELADFLSDTWHRNPVVVYCTFHSPAAREIKGILRDYNLRPSPTIFDVDQRADSDVLFPLLSRLTGDTPLPIVYRWGTSDWVNGNGPDASREWRAQAAHHHRGRSNRWGP